MTVFLVENKAKKFVIETHKTLIMNTSFPKKFVSP